MKRFGISFSIKNIPSLDPGFMPLWKFREAYLKGASKPIGIAITRNDGNVAVKNTYIHGSAEYAEADIYYIDRLVKELLWTKGGYKIDVCGDESIYESLKSTYCDSGSRSFDYDFMSNVYEQEFSVNLVDELPSMKEAAAAAGGNINGCRIGFDAGGSDRKVSAVIDGECVFSEEVLWLPKITEDPDYHYNEIVTAFKTAASHMPRVDAIGISSAGIYVDNRVMVASLFLKVDKELFDKKVKDIYIRAAANYGDVPVVVQNDGDVTALTAAIAMEKRNTLGIAMGTSEAAGYVNADGNLMGWLSELAFAPVDVSPNAMIDEWSHDTGCGVKYFSQDGVIKLAIMGGIDIPKEADTLAKKLKVIQELVELKDEVATQVFISMGIYLGHTIPLYKDIYGFDNLLLLGRVMSGRGGELMLEYANKVLEEEYSELDIHIILPDERMRRVGQSVIAAGLPKIQH